MSTTEVNISKKHKTDNILKYISIVIFSLYLSVVFYLTVFKSIYYLYLFPAFFLFMFFVSKYLSEKFIDIQFNQISGKSHLHYYQFFIITFFIIFLGQILYWLSYYPGGFNLDALGQWDQAHGNMQLNNWHPVITTGFYYTLTKIYDSLAFCIFVQLFLFSLSCTCLLSELFRLKIKEYILIPVSVYIGLSPAIGMNNVCLYKDVLFSVAIIFLTTLTIKITESSGEWLNSFIHRIFLISDLIMIVLIRHNGLFFVIPFLLCLIIILRKNIKQFFSVTLAFAVFVILIQGPVFSLLSVTKHSNFTGESVGVPMSVMANAYINDYDNTPDDVKEFMNNIAEYDQWKERYIIGEWDSCKWDFGGIELFKNEKISNIVGMAVKTAFVCPEAAYQSIRENTRVVWQIFGNVCWDTWVYIEPNEYNIVENPNEPCSIITDKILNFSLITEFTFLFWNIGTPLICFFFFVIFVISRKEYNKLIYCVPSIAYNLLTMLLLCGPSHRYFYFNNVIFLSLIILIFLSNKKRNICS